LKCGAGEGWEKISWTDRARNEEVLHRVKEHRNILHKITRNKANWIGHIVCRNCLVKHTIEGKTGGGI
jgi:predicted small metal-binding protein